MNSEILNKAVEFAADHPVFVATASGEGQPHVAAAGHIEMAANKRVIITEWLCPGTVANLEDNPAISVVAWDPSTDEGYQLVGHLNQLDTEAVLDGYAQTEETGEPVPQQERRLDIVVDEILAFHQAPHTDQPV